MSQSITDKEILQAGFRYAMSLAHNFHDAEDLVQEAWIKLCRVHGKVENKSLLFITIRNLFIDQYRRKNLVLIESLDSSQEPMAMEESLDLSIDIIHIESALQQLRVEEREVIFLSTVEGYTSQQIAELTNRSRNTILSLLHRGRKKLIEILKAKGINGRHLA